MADPAAQARLEAALPAALERLQATSGVYAVLWCGSAARGEANEFSDLDFHALVSGDERWRTNFLVGDVPVEVFHNPVRKVRAMFAEPDAACLVMFAEGKMVVPHPELSALQQEAQAILAVGRKPEPVPEFTRFMLVDSVWDARAALHDPIHIKVVMGALDPLVMRPLYALRGWWEVKPQAWLTDLQAKDAALAQELHLLLTAEGAVQRQAAFEALAGRVAGELNYRAGGSARQRVP